MKVQIDVKFKTNPEANSTVDLTVGTADTVSSVKEQVAAMQLIPFPEQHLVLNGKVLEDGQQLSECGVTDSSSLDLAVGASDATLVQQLKELLQARDLSPDELSLLYCYKYGVSMNQALQMLGHKGKLQDFLNEQKQFLLESGRVTLVREDTKLKPFSVTSEIAQILKSSPNGTMDIKDLSAKFAQKFNVSISSIVGARPADFFARESDLFVLTGRRLVSLKSASTTTSTNDNQQNSQEPAQLAKQQAEPLPSSVPPPPGLENCVAAADLAPGGSVESQQYLDLHNKISSRSFNAKVAQALNNIVDTVSEIAFLNVQQVVKGGSIGKGTAISGVTDAEVVFFLQGLPTVGHERWLPPLMRAVSGVLGENLHDENGVESIRTLEDGVQLCVRGPMVVDLRFSPICESYKETIQELGKQGPEARRYYSPSLVRERVQFIAKQPGQVKVTIRLLKWWRDQQEWSGKLVRPSDEILELIAVYSAVQTKPADQRAAIASVMSLLSRFSELRIVWSNFYSKDDVWAPLLRQRPLLMDPTNPFVNIADPQAFDPRELMHLARTTHFFW